MQIRDGRGVRAGFSLVEVMVALLLVSVALVALESGAAVTVRTLADAERESVAARLAEGSREGAYSTSCVAARGVDTVNGVRVAWSATPFPVAGVGVLVTRAAGSFRTRYGVQARIFDGAGACR